MCFIRYVDTISMEGTDDIRKKWEQERSKHPSVGEGKCAEELQRMWDDSADIYDDSAYSYIANDMVHKLVGRGVLNKNSTVLDIGCGTGSFAFNISPFVSRVIGTDGSEKMIDRMMFSAEEKGVKNIEPLLADCFHIPSETVCDVAFTSLCPPMNDPDALLLMEKHSSEYCVYISSANIGHGIEIEIWEALGCDYSYAGYDISYPYEFLTSIGRDVEISYFTQRNASSVPEKKCVEMYTRFLSNYRTLTDKEKDIVKNIVRKHSVDGFVDMSRDMRMGMLIWRVE